MAWTAPTTQSTGHVVLASEWNTDLVDNMAETMPGVGAWTDYTPVLKGAVGDPTLSDDASHEADGRYLHVGRTVFWSVRFQFGTSGADPGSGQYYVVLPVNANIDGFATAEIPCGSGSALDSGGSSHTIVQAVIVATVAVRFNVNGGARLTDSTPFTWAAGDELSFFAVYEAGAHPA